MDKLNQFIERLEPFFQKYGLFIAPVLLFLFFMTLLVISYTSQPSKQQTAVSIPSQTQTNTNNTSSNSGTSGQTKSVPVPSYSLSPFPTSSGMDPDNDEPNLPVWTGATFSPDDFGIDIQQTTLTNGETQYSYNSNTPNRPDIVIVKGGVNVFERTVMYNIPFDASVATSPDYISKGSLFWGNNAETYIYLSKGLADVIDTTNKQIVEEIIFEPNDLKQFQSYDTDMIGTPQKP